MVTQIDLDLVDDYPASDPRWAESVPDGKSPLYVRALDASLGISPGLCMSTRERR